MNNEIAIALLFGLFGWKVTAIYIGFGLLVAILGGFVIGRLNMEKYVLIDVKPMEGELEEVKITLTMKERAKEAYTYTRDIFKDIYLYVIIGVGIGVLIHGYIPADFIAKYAGAQNPFAVLVAVIMGMPLVEVLTDLELLLVL